MLWWILIDIGAIYGLSLMSVLLAFWFSTQEVSSDTEI